MGPGYRETFPRGFRLRQGMRRCFLALLVVALAVPVLAQSPPKIQIHRAAGPITLDGELNDPGWKGAAQITTFYEVTPGNNTPPKVATTAYLTYDDRFFYVAFKCDDPTPKKIRAHFVQRDHVASDQDFVGIILDTRYDKRTAQEFWVNPYGIVDDGIRDESNVTGNTEDFSPDFYWDAAAKITRTGWQAEFRIPFSSLRYSKKEPQAWGITLFRNWPRDYRYQIANVLLPRDSTCEECHEAVIEGLAGLPHGVHYVVAPYVTAQEQGAPSDGAGSPLVNKPARGNGGVDVKFLPSENNALDATINPDFSQVESDVAQISADARFALNYPEKRPFFLEQSQLFNTPIPAVYTRSITSPRWGIRDTGRLDDTEYTFLLGEDRGGGSVILPGADTSSYAPQDFNSYFAIGRAQRDLGDRSFGSFLLTDREIEGGGHNRVLGPDFQWTPEDHDQVTGQFLLSESQTPNRPDLAPQWNGQSLGSRAFTLQWNHGTYHWGWNVRYNDYGDNFRADDGFVPQVGLREGAGNLNYVFFTQGFFSRIIPVFYEDYVSDTSGRIVTRIHEPGIAWQGPWGMNGEIDYVWENDQTGGLLLPRNRWHYNLNLNPPGWITSFSLDGHTGQSIDFVDSRTGKGTDFTASVTVRPEKHLELDINEAWQWLDIGGARLFKAQVDRIEPVWVFNAKAFLRVIGQYVRTDSNAALYNNAIPAHQGGFTGSALFGYQVNWQTVFYLGYGDTRALNDQTQLQRTGREFFLKLSYAFQR